MRTPNDCSVQWVIWSDGLGFYYQGSHLTRKDAIAQMESDFGHPWLWMKRSWGVKAMQVRFVPVKGGERD